MSENGNGRNRYMEDEVRTHKLKQKNHVPNGSNGRKRIALNLSRMLDRKTETHLAFGVGNTSSQASEREIERVKMC